MWPRTPVGKPPIVTDLPMPRQRNPKLQTQQPFGPFVVTEAFVAIHAGQERPGQRVSAMSAKHGGLGFGWGAQNLGCGPPIHWNDIHFGPEPQTARQTQAYRGTLKIENVPPEGGMTVVRHWPQERPIHYAPESKKLPRKTWHLSLAELAKGELRIVLKQWCVCFPTVWPPIFMHQALKPDDVLYQGRERRVRFRLPHLCVLPDDVHGHSQGFGALHYHLRLRDACELVAKHRDHWHDDSRLACGPQWLLCLLQSLVAGSRQFWLCTSHWHV